jgi:hypothetical protein
MGELDGVKVPGSLAEIVSDSEVEKTELSTWKVTVTSFLDLSNKLTVSVSVSGILTLCMPRRHNGVEV